jgi:hypothetical protein
MRKETTGKKYVKSANTSEKRTIGAQNAVVTSSGKTECGLGIAPKKSGNKKKADPLWVNGRAYRSQVLGTS